MAFTNVAASCAHALGLTLLLAALAGCGERQAEAVGAAPSPSAGQVAPTSAAPKASFYAASRFAEQASFGATPALVAELQAKGFEAWIDEQMALPASLLDTSPVDSYTRNITPEDYDYVHRTKYTPMLSGADQLRQRVSWALSQWIVVGAKADPAGTVHWANLLHRQALDNYGSLLRAVTLSPAMGYYLDNSQNRPKSVECPNCAPNENFARELMQLFTLGVVKLNLDGSLQRNSRGQPVETYTQRDVEELARVLTGWTFNNDPVERGFNWGNWGKPMTPSVWPPERDSGAKTVLGRSFPANQSANKDLDDTVAMLMVHENIAPFVALRVIQHLVKSDPSPAYLARMATLFRNNGQGVAGDMKTLVKAVLLDREARDGDDPAIARSSDGKVREPHLFHTAVLRALGCQRIPTNGWGSALGSMQNPYWASSVFSFYAATDRAPGSRLLAPEQKLLNASELTSRLVSLANMRWQDGPSPGSDAAFTRGGCDVAQVYAAFAQSPKAFADWTEKRFFRGAMPPPLRRVVEQRVREASAATSDMRHQSALRILSFALTSPSFGAPT